MLVLLDLLHLFRWHKRVSDILLLQVEVLEINLPTLHVWLDWRSNLLRFQICNVQVAEPRVLKNFVDIHFSAKTLGGVLAQQLFNDVDKLIRVIKVVLFFVGEDHLGSLNLGKQQVFVFIEEWSYSNSHFVD